MGDRKGDRPAPWWTRVPVRLPPIQRLQPSFLSRPVLMVVVAGWVAMLMVGALILVRSVGGTQPFDADVVSTVILTLAIATTASATLASLLLRRGSSLGRHVALGLCLLGGFLPARALLVDGRPVVAAMSAACALTTVALAVVVTRRRVAQDRLVVAAAASGALSWLIGLVEGWSLPTGSSLWVFSIVTAFPVFLLIATFAVAETAETRLIRATRDRTSREVAVGIVVLVLVVKIAVLALRFTVARSLFGPNDAALWTWRSWSSWPHGLLVALCFAALALRSWHSPVRRRGQRLLTAALVVGAASVPTAVLADQVVSAFLVTGPLVGNSDALYRLRTTVPVATNEWFYTTSHWWAFGIVIGLVVLMGAAPLYRRTAGRYQAVVAAVYLVPPVLAIAVFEELPTARIPPVWTSPVQVDVALTALVAVLVTWSAIRRRWPVPRALLIRLLVAPFVAIHAAAALPEALDSSLTAPLVVGGSFVALVALVPPDPPDPVAHAGNVTRASAIQGAFLVAYLMVVLVGLQDSGRGDVLAILWLAIPVSLGLCLQMRPRGPVQVLGSSSPGSDAVGSPPDPAWPPPSAP